MSRGRARRATVLAALGCLIGSSAAVAQVPDVWRGSIEVAGGAGWVGGHPLGTASATLRSSEAPRGSDFSLFQVTSDVEPHPLAELAVGYHLTRVFGVEGRFGYARPPIHLSISDDPEVSDVSFVGEHLRQYSFDVSLVVHLTGIAPAGGRLLPFVYGGAGYLRELHDDPAVVETGRRYHAGGGVKYLLVTRSGRVLDGVGVRGDVRFLVRDGGLELDGARRSFGAASASLFLLF